MAGLTNGELLYRFLACGDNDPNIFSFHEHPLTHETLKGAFDAFPLIYCLWNIRPEGEFLCPWDDDVWGRLGLLKQRGPVEVLGKSPNSTAAGQ
jgi:hypothetical protein